VGYSAALQAHAGESRPADLALEQDAEEREADQVEDQVERVAVQQVGAEPASSRSNAFGNGPKRATSTMKPTTQVTVTITVTRRDAVPPHARGRR
jgi:hypothetical protein